jgi:hypothetical protein
VLTVAVTNTSSESVALPGSYTTGTLHPRPTAAPIPFHLHGAATTCDVTVTVLQPGETCTVGISFVPEAEGTFFAFLCLGGVGEFAPGRGDCTTLLGRGG